MKKSKTSKPKTAPLPFAPDTKAPEMTVEWQVIPGDTNTIHVFHSRGAVFGFLAREWQRFVLSWVSDRTCRLSVEVRRVEREVVKT